MLLYIDPCGYVDVVKKMGYVFLHVSLYGFTNELLPRKSKHYLY